MSLRALFQMYTGVSPVSVPLIQWLAKVSNRGHSHLQQPAGMRDELWDVLQQCLHLNPAHRPGTEDVVQALVNFD